METKELDSLIDQELREAETERVKNAKSMKRFYWIFFSLGLVGIGLVFFLNIPSPFYFIPGFLLLIPFAVNMYLKKNLGDRIKEKILPIILKKMRPGWTYLSNQFITKAQFEESNLFKRPDRYKGEDLVSGKNKKTTFSFSEVHAEEKKTTHSNGKSKTTYSTIFKGIFMIADFNKHIKCETYVYTTGGKFWSKYKRVKMEDPEFESRFDVFSDDQIEARYILTPAMMRRIVQLEKKFNCKLYLSFIGNHVYIAMGNSMNYFEPDVTKEISPAAMEEIVKEMDECISIIEDLDLNTRIWTKE